MIRRTNNARLGKDTWETATIVPEMIREWRRAWQFRQANEGEGRCLFIHYEGILFGSESQRLSEFLGVELPPMTAMVTAQEKHFQRQNLNGAIVGAIRAMPEFSDYFSEIESLLLPIGPKFHQFSGHASLPDLAKLGMEHVQDFVRRARKYRLTREW